MTIKKIGFIGLGVMGVSMAAHLMEAGYSLTVFNRTKEKAAGLIRKGARWAPSPAAVAADADVVISMVGYPQDVEEIYIGKSGVLQTMRGGYIIDMTTSSPLLAVRLYEAAQEKGIAALDAPVSGGDIGARNASLVIMVGGESEAFEAVKPILEVLGRTVEYFGAAGSGQYTKMTNQIVIAGTMMGVCEAVAYAKKAGLDTAKVIDTISGGAAGSWSLAHLAPRMLRGDQAPGFFIKHFIKDMRIALDSAAQMHLDLPALALAKRLYDELAARGMEDYGTQALIQWYLKE